MVVDGEVDDIDDNNDQVDQDELVQTLIIKIKIFIRFFKKDEDVLEGHVGGRLSNPWPAIGVEGVGNGKPDGWDPVGVAPGRVEGCSGNCGRLISYR